MIHTHAWGLVSSTRISGGAVGEIVMQNEDKSFMIQLKIKFVWCLAGIPSAECVRTPAPPKSFCSEVHNHLLCLASTDPSVFRWPPAMAVKKLVRAHRGTIPPQVPAFGPRKAPLSFGATLRPHLCSNHRPTDKSFHHLAPLWDLLSRSFSQTLDLHLSCPISKPASSTNPCHHHSLGYSPWESSLHHSFLT